MQIIGIILWVIGVLYAIAWGFTIRQKAKNEQASEYEVLQKSNERYAAESYSAINTKNE